MEYVPVGFGTTQDATPETSPTVAVLESFVASGVRENVTVPVGKAIGAPNTVTSNLTWLVPFIVLVSISLGVAWTTSWVMVAGCAVPFACNAATVMTRMRNFRAKLIFIYPSQDDEEAAIKHRHLSFAH